MHAHEKWIVIAQEDVLAAAALLKLELFSSAVYHCQQAAEKSLKAYLAFKLCPITKTHDLIKLLELCMTFDQEFRKKFEAADYLNPFATRFRYPTEFDIPTKHDTILAIKHANSIIKFVVKKILDQAAGQMQIT